MCKSSKRASHSEVNGQITKCSPKIYMTVQSGWNITGKIYIYCRYSERKL